MLIQGLYYERIKKFETWYCYYWEIPHNYLNIDNIDKDNTLFDNNDENNEKKKMVDSGQHINNVNMESKNDKNDE